ncbi:MAG: DUF4159 domain-containing protein [Bacteroidetes bacterium]|nr:DUF4159 domain-containing protein [Bacteroidota bacterium]
MPILSIKKIWFKIVLLSILALPCTSFSPASYQIGLLKYNGGGDWYANPTSLPNLVKFANRNLGTGISEEIATVEAGNPEIMNYPFIHMTGHGNVVFSEQEARNLRKYLMAGGFLHIDDNYGLDKYIRPQLKLIFPELELIELPFSHPVYHQKYDFPNGLPKIHEHDGKPPQGFGLIWEGRLVVFYSYECDLGDGWEDPDVHHDSEPTRLKALQMGSNLLKYAFTLK